jgi:hypothetical protein
MACGIAFGKYDDLLESKSNRPTGQIPRLVNIL